jgi:hypothetical protein
MQWQVYAFPLWGNWNGLLIDLRKVHNKALREQDKVLREQSALSELLNCLSQSIKSAKTKVWLPDFYQQSQVSPVL